LAGVTDGQDEQTPPELIIFIHRTFLFLIGVVGPLSGQAGRPK
jgi:hypothetical protein